MPAAPSRQLSPTRSLCLSWSGGKDSALALWRLREREGRLPGFLLSTVVEGEGRISMHGVRSELVRRQAQSLGVGLVEVEIPTRCPDSVYEQRMGDAFLAGALREVREVAFGDLFLGDIRAYRENRLAGVGRAACFPVWGLDTAELASEFVAAGFRAILVCVDTRALPASFAGRDFDERLLGDLPARVDPCGENGEFHTFVYDGPIFKSPVEVERGAVTERDGFAFCDLLGGGPA